MSSFSRLQRPATHQVTKTLRSITSTPLLYAPPKTKAKSAEEPKVKQQKGGNKAKTPSASQTANKEAASAKMERMVVTALDAPYVGPPAASEEEMAHRYQIGRNFVIGSWERHNEMNHDLAVKIRMKRYAIKNLPKEGQLGDGLVSVNNEGEAIQETSVYGRWREEAMKIDDFPGPPGHRPIPMYTPPIPGFNIEEYMENDDEK